MTSVPQLISMSGTGYERYVLNVSTTVGKCQAEPPNHDLFIPNQVELPTIAICPIKGEIHISAFGACAGPSDGSTCDNNKY